METVLWGVIVVVLALIILGALIPELLSRRTRKREKRLGNRAKRRIEL